MTEHTVKSFGSELDALSTDLARMGGLVESLVNDSITAVVRRDTALAQSVIERDPRVDASHRDMERRVTRMVALRQPVAIDLRETLSVWKIAGDLERIGDLAKNISKRTLVLNQADPVQLTRSIERMGRLAGSHLKQVLDAYSQRDADLGIGVWYRDEEIDAYYNSLFRELLTYMMEDPRTIGPCAHLLFIAKNIERIGDHCTNIAETVHYLVTGEEMPVNRPKADEAERTPV
ncbi:MAG TPA: phosphate signaling complex protein PhoU [Caulobacterales bacterium]|nr:phosphate signaling complex protein PhoU [Caulobacterales bacterium]